MGQVHNPSPSSRRVEGIYARGMYKFRGSEAYLEYEEALTFVHRAYPLDV